MKYLSLALLLMVSACGALTSTPAPAETGAVTLEAQAISGGTLIPPTSWCAPIFFPGDMDSVVIFKGAVADNIPLNCRTNVPLSHPVVVQFASAQTPSLIRVELKYVPFMAFPRNSTVTRTLNCIWSSNNRTYTCPPSVTLLEYDTTYRLNVYNSGLLRAKADFKTEMMVFAP